MSVEIILKGNIGNIEYQDALDLKKIFEDYFRENVKSATGKILIYNSATLFGQEVKDIDLVVIGSLQKFPLNIKFKTDKDQTFKKRSIFINSFCFCIETKRQTSRDVYREGLNILVNYKNKKSDVTTQSEKQKYSLKNYFYERLGYNPYICNFIWFRNFNKDNIKELLGTEYNHNVLYNDFSMGWLFQLACIQKEIKEENNLKFSSFRSNFDDDSPEVFNLFEEVKNNIGELTRRKIETISKKLLGTQKYAEEIGEKLLEISGRAGTGKTIKLLRLACDLATNKDKRCLILTYNHALVSDIKRILAIIGIPDGVDNYTVRISTLHKFIYELMIGFDINTIQKGDKIYVPGFITNYEKNISDLFQYIDNGLIEERDIQKLMKSRHDEVNYDIVLIDEAQDWLEQEKIILYKIFSPERIILANGKDQLIRRPKYCNWTSGIDSGKIKKDSSNKNLRQKKNLVDFINLFAENFGINWNVERSEEMNGGNVKILTKGFSKEVYDEESKYLMNNGNIAYDMLFLAPPNLVKRTKVIDKSGMEKEKREFVFLDNFKKMDINLWDGTSTDIRTEYPVDPKQHRVLQYDSCRGLEGWIVTCLNFDDFFQYKFDTFVEDTSENTLALESLNDKRLKFAYIWTLIPLTRAIDTLVITLRNKNSNFSQKLKELSQDFDFISWIE